jgi:hypothetical protein
MADQPPVHGNGADGTRQRPPGPSVPNSVTPGPAEATSPTPRWVKVFAIIGVVLVLLIIVMLLTGHGPGRHMHSALGGHTTPVSLAVDRGTALDGGQP